MNKIIQSTLLLLFSLITTISYSQIVDNTIFYDGNDDYIATTYTPPASGESPFTYSAWVNLISGQLEHIVVGTCSSSTSWNGYWVNVKNEKLIFYNSGFIEGNLSVPNDTWVHVAVTYDGTNIKMYVNGILDIEQARTVNNTGGDLYIGAIGARLHTGSLAHGNIDNVSVWNVARTQEQIQAEMCEGLEGNEVGLIDFYDFNQGIPEGDNTSITTLTSKTGNNTGTLTNFALTGAGSNFVNSEVVFPIRALDITTCSENEILVGSKPNSGTGAWSILSGHGTVTNPAYYNSTITGLEDENTTILKWTVSNLGCINATTMTITDNHFTVTANDISTCNGTVNLTANNLGDNFGQWTILAGSGTIEDETLYNSEISNIDYESSTTLKWTVNSSGCIDETTITVTNNSFEVTATNVETCTGTATLTGNNPNIRTGLWTKISGSGTIQTPTLYNSEIINIDESSETSLKWTVSDINCSVEKTISVINNYLTAIASDITTCTGSATLIGNNPNGNVGLWTLVTGSGVIENLTTYNTEISDIDTESSTILKWTINSSGCISETSITITNNGFSINAGDNANVTTNSYQLNGDNPLPGTGIWSILQGGGNLADNTNNTTMVTDLQEGDNTFSWTVTRNLCEADDNVTITYTPLSVDDNFKFNISVYPNPTNSNFNIEGIKNYKLTLSNLSGKILLKKSINTNTTNIDVSNLTNGVYFIKIENKNGTYIEKIIKK